MKILFFICFLGLVTGCVNQHDENDHEIPMLQKNIKAFINAKKCFGEPTEIVAVNLTVRSDTLYLEMVNSYPNFNEVKFVYDTVIEGRRILFTGEKIKGYHTNLSSGRLPKDIREINKQRELNMFKEGTNWLLVYFHGALVRKSLDCDNNNK
jgi:hypothetical protein